MKKMVAGSFKTNCLAVMDGVQAKHRTVVVTKCKPVASAPAPWGPGYCS
jgi:hypothetical protein